MNYFIYTSHHFTRHGRYELNYLTSLPMCGFIAQLVEHRTGIAEVTGSNPVEALIFFQASPFQLLKLENLLRWSFFTFIYNRSSNMNYFIYTSHPFARHGKIWTQLFDLSPSVWLHSSVGRASYGIAEVTGSKPVEALFFFFRLLSNCLNWKIYCDDHSSLSSTTAVQFWIISDILHNTISIFQVNTVAPFAQPGAILTTWQVLHSHHT